MEDRSLPPGAGRILAIDPARTVAGVHVETAGGVCRFVVPLGEIREFRLAVGRRVCLLPGPDGILLRLLPPPYSRIR